MNVLDRIEIDEAQLADICRRYHVRELALFGSVLRDDFRDDSDVDVLVEFEPDARIGFIGYLDLQEELAGLLGRSVDLISKDGMRPRFAARVLPQLRVIYAA
ncbi:MAG: nucleotidyltransferase [Chloroflexi bacterium]|nr:MAG: nucleotidyltransferase [Chloroflexota bacterium]